MEKLRIDDGVVAGIASGKHSCLYLEDDSGKHLLAVFVDEAAAGAMHQMFIRLAERISQGKIISMSIENND